MSERLVVDYEGRIARPAAEVGAQFGDMRHHASHTVHKGIVFTVHSDDRTTCRFRQAVRLLGMMQVDEVVLTRNADGSLTSDVVSGTNAGTRFTQRFEGGGRGGTIVHFRADLPVSGIRRLLKPLFRRAVYGTIDKAFREDIVDLEQKGYPRQA
ncbi:MAG: hypothetical protein KF889_12350 [Alphaproteobacteria bacterium]|nr:hypothetical protein [Alphaproteobacteria bacterium]MCW5739217.1 hypothetical protein [Alphaproteobacteria bacterium]